ncbi:MAG: hypothetical protein WC455_23315 [Dehalococcoidia bacterium]|jgi:hypothetical protein
MTNAADLPNDLLLRCISGTVHLALDDIEEGQFCVSMVGFPHTLCGRLEHAWWSLCGRRFYWSEAYLTRQDAARMAEWLQVFVERRREQEEG